MPIGDRKLTVQELDRVAPEAYAPSQARPVVVVLDDVRSRHNVGSIFRTADAFGAEKLLLCGFTPLPPHREIEKTALGATHSVEWAHKASSVDAVKELRTKGYRVFAIEQTKKAIALNDLKIENSPIALVFGNELNGVSDEVIAACDGCIVIPQHGSKHSLNVSVCAGIILWWTRSDL